jgi:predicted TPR repeat methyltransferase
LWDFGSTPLANSYLSKEDLDKPEMYFPLAVNQCQDCGNVQLAHVVDPKLMFSHYLYTSSTSPVFVKHFEDFANSVGKKDFVVDIGGNDGILLKPFQAMGSRVLNVEPAENIACELPVIHSFFDSLLAREIVEQYGHADLVTATNVFAHIDDLDEVVNGVKILLTDDGVFVVEVTDIEKMIETGSFDLIYHEHVNYWSEDAFRKFFAKRGMEVTKIEKIPVHGGSLRVYARVLQQNN